MIVSKVSVFSPFETLLFPCKIAILMGCRADDGALTLAKKAGLHWWRLDEMGRASTKVWWFLHQFDVSVTWVFP